MKKTQSMTKTKMIVAANIGHKGFGHKTARHRIEIENKKPAANLPFGGCPSQKWKGKWILVTKANERILNIAAGVFQ